MTAPDVRAAAQAEAEQRWRREAGRPWHRVFVSGAVWGAALVTPTVDQLAMTVAQFFGPNDTPEDVAKGVLKLMAGLAEGERG